MKKLDIYTENYFNLKMKEEENNFIESLNGHEITSIVKPFLEKILNELFLRLSDKGKSISIDEFIIDDTKLNQALTIYFSNVKEFEHIQEEEIKSNLFTIAYKKLIGRIFLQDVVNDENYSIQRHIHSWLEDNLAIELSKDNRFSTFESLENVMNQTEMLHRFYNTFITIIPLDWIKSDIANWTKTSNNMRDILDTFGSRDEYFQNYAQYSQKFDSYTDWKYIEESTRNSEYVIFSNKYAFKNGALFNNYIDGWIDFWDNLSFTLLQDVPFSYIRKPQDIVKISTELVNKKVLKSDPKRLAYILLKNLFENSLHVQQNLSFYGDTERLNGLSNYESNTDLLKRGEILFNSWKPESEEIYKDVLQKISILLNEEEISKWAFSYKSTFSGNPKYVNQYNQEIGNILNAYKHVISRDTKVQLNNVISDFNLQKFGFFTTEFLSEEVSDADISQLLNSYVEYIRSKDFYWDKSFSQTYWPSIKGIGKLLSMSDNPIKSSKSLIETVRVYHEGWNLLSDNYSQTSQESFVYCGAILLLEHESSFKSNKEKESYFLFILDLCVSQTRFSILEPRDYVLPIYLLGLIANQIYTPIKLTYETSIIKLIDDINTVIELLTIGDYKLESKSKALLKSRMDDEIEFEKRMLYQRKNKNGLLNLEKQIEKLSITIA